MNAELVVLASSEGVPRYLTATAALVLAAAVVGYLSVRVRVLPIVGFLLAGVLIGPAQLGLVSSTEAVDAAAEIGVILMLFTICIEFSLERLARVWRWVVFGGGSQVVLATGAGLAVTVALRRSPEAYRAVSPTTSHAPTVPMTRSPSGAETETDSSPSTTKKAVSDGSPCWNRTSPAA